MRISSSTITSMTSSSMSNAYNNYMKILSKISSNKNFTKMSENPLDASKVLKLNDQLAQLNQFQSNIQAAINEMNMAYDTLGEVTNKVSEINSLVVQAANSTTTSDSAKAIAADIKEKVLSIKDMMNTKYLDNYIFSGTFTQDAPYVQDEDGNITYQGSSKEAGDRNLTIAPNTTFAYNMTGEEVFGSDDDVNDFFRQMSELDTLLNADELDYDKIREKLSVLEKTTKNISSMQGVISAKVTKLTSTQSINEDTITSLTEKKAGIEELDIIEAAGDLAAAQQALQASYLVGSSTLGSVSLLDYL